MTGGICNVYFTKRKIYLSGHTSQSGLQEPSDGAEEAKIFCFFSAVLLAEKPMKDLSETLNIRPPVKLFRIGEIAEFRGVSRQTVHNYTAMGLITEDKRSAGGHRLYDESVFDALARIEQLKRSKTLAEIRRQLSAERAGGDQFSRNHIASNAQRPTTE